MQTVIGSSDQTLHPQASTQFSRTGSFHSQSQDVEAQLSTAGNRETLVLEGKLPPLLRKNTENIPYELHKERLAKRVHIKSEYLGFALRERSFASSPSSRFLLRIHVFQTQLTRLS